MIMKLLQQVIGVLSDEIQIVMAIDKTKHAGQRQSRDTDAFIADETIKTALDDAIKIIGKNLLMGKISHNQRLLIVNHRYDPPLNIIGVIERSDQKLKFVVITIMYSNQFRTHRTKTLEIN